MLSIGISNMNGGYEEKKKKQAQEWAKLGTNSWELVSFIEELYFKYII